MSEKAITLFEQDDREQQKQNQARRIRTRVQEARSSPQPAAFRWPFELLQNALDAGLRKGASAISVRVRFAGDKVRFEHTGAPFNSRDLAALLSGGSSKEFESNETTGRFGTGFLVTHVLANRARLSGLMAVEEGWERFDLMLDRGGTEQAILQNIDDCRNAIRLAVPVAILDGHPSAIFEYEITDPAPFETGLNALTASLPYLFGTRVALGSVEIELPDRDPEFWNAAPLMSERTSDGGYCHTRDMVRRGGGQSEAKFRILRFESGEGAKVGCLVLLKENDGGYEVCVPPGDQPKLYREYPVRGSSFLPINTIIDGKFDPDQERWKLLMTDSDQSLLVEGLRAAVVAARTAIQAGWSGAHWLTAAGPPASGFDSTNIKETDWWRTALRDFAEMSATMKMVSCEGGFLPAKSKDAPEADFIVPQLLRSSKAAETTVERVWTLAALCSDLCPPVRELAKDWTEIADGWYHLGVQISRATVDRVGEFARDGAKSLDDLKVKGDKRAWLTLYLDVIGECWDRRAGVDLSVLNGIMPNEHGALCSPEALSRDGGIPNELKDICARAGDDIRATLLSNDVSFPASEPDLRFLSKTLAIAVPKTLSESAVVEDLVGRLRATFPEDQEVKSTAAPMKLVAKMLLEFLWTTKGPTACQTAQRIPLFASNGRAVYWSLRRMMMAPVASWPQSAQPFADAYPENRVLAPEYSALCVQALEQWGVARCEPISSDVPAELTGPRLAALAESASPDLVVSDTTFSQVALLQPEVLNRCQENRVQAQALLGLILSHVAPNDPRWREKRTISAKRGRDLVPVVAHGALWLADLKFRAWVPVLQDDGKWLKTVADQTTLRPMLDPKWLAGNNAAVELLSMWFGFDELELRLLSTIADEAQRKHVRDELAKLVEIGGAEPAIYAALADEVRAKQMRSRDVNRCRELGLAVQEAISQALQARGLTLKLVDRGFDYEVESKGGDVVDDGATHLEVGTWLLEVKASARGQARMTPAQVAMASEEAARYVLCVVDLRAITPDEMSTTWTPERVEPISRIVTDIGSRVKETSKLVSLARDCPVGIRNHEVLRYEVATEIWESGISIKRWVDSIQER